MKEFWTKTKDVLAPLAVVTVMAATAAYWRWLA
jgi:hypothetical protein